ncbi:MAG TPA: hypothetical protein VHO28_10700 [Ignavibacteriales bacterium]|nr:hypothetical protein [Ignavibacteriales bacterium]
MALRPVGIECKTMSHWNYKVSVILYIKFEKKSGKVLYRKEKDEIFTGELKANELEVIIE